MIEVELPDGSVAEFPDGTAPEVMKRALSKYRAPAVPAQQATPPGPRPRQNIDEILDPREGLTGNPLVPYVPPGFVAGAGQAVDRALDATTQMFLDAGGEESASKAMRGIVAEKRDVDAPLSDSTEGTLGNIAGNVAMTAIPASKIAKSLAVATKAPTVLKNALMAKRGLAGPMLNAAPSAAAQTAAGFGSAAAVGAGSGALVPVAEDESREDNIETGVITGIIGQGLGNVVGRGISGLVKKSKDYLALPKAVQAKTTLGQAADDKTIIGRAASRLEESAKSVPFAGSVVANARRRGTEAWRDELVERVSPTNFRPNPNNPSTRDSIAEIQDAFSARYKAALKGHQISADPGFTNRVAAIVDDPTSGLTREQGEAVKELVGRYHDKMFPPSNPGAAVSADVAKDFESFLTTKARNLRRATTAEAPDLAKAYDAIEEAWTKIYRSQLPPGGTHSAQLAQLDDLYSRFKTVERAAAAVGNEGGDFTPSQLLNSVKARSTQSQFGAGRAPLQRDAQAGKAVFGDHLPDSGTAERALTTGMGFGVVTQAPKIAAALGIGVPAMTTQAGKNMMMGDAKIQKLLQKLRTSDMARWFGAPANIAAQQQADQAPLYEE